MRKRGVPDDEIVEALASKGHTYQEIAESLNQADIKSGVSSAPQNFSNFGQMEESALSKTEIIPSDEEIPVPSPPQSSASPSPSPSLVPKSVELPSKVELVPQFSALPSSDIQELVESIIEDRWQQVVSSVGDISLWKGRVDDDLASVKQEILRVEDRLTKLQAALIGRVDEYSRSISRVGSEVAALEKVFEKVLEPLSSNIKELNRITQEMKRKS